MLHEPTWGNQIVVTDSKPCSTLLHLLALLMLSGVAKRKKIIMIINSREGNWSSYISGDVRPSDKHFVWSVLTQPLSLPFVSLLTSLLPKPPLFLRLASFSLITGTARGSYTHLTHYSNTVIYIHKWSCLCKWISIGSGSFLFYRSQKASSNYFLCDSRDKELTNDGCHRKYEV